MQTRADLHITIYNTLTRREEVFAPLKGNRVNMFVCGPTVYDDMHLGHARTYLAYDVMARFLRHVGYSLFYIMNITDVDDKIIDRAREKGVDPMTVAREYERRFHDDMLALGITSINLYARASEHLDEIIEQIAVLIKKGHAYETETGVYYDVTTFPRYGELSHQDPEELVKHRIDPDPTKRHPQDFALWRKKPRSEFGWDSPWGYGRPGWHIEDTAITITYFGPTYDIHGGAIELVFPHHEAEIAQAEAFTGFSPLVRYWVHTGLLTVRGEKMSKSLGNFVTVRDLLSEYDPNVIRFYLISAHYRSPIDFKEEALEQAASSVESLTIALSSFIELDSDERLVDYDVEFQNKVAKAHKRFMASMCSDFHTPSAIASLFELASEMSKVAEGRSRINRGVKEEALKTFREMLSILGLQEVGALVRPENRILYDLVRLVIEVRERLRREKRYELADEIRGRLGEVGIILEDSSQGTRWRLIRRASRRG